MQKNTQKQYFTRALLSWNTNCNNRQMPWKGEKDPYRIWLSEIILQQTRVDQGLEYYNRFIKTYPSIQQLAAAPDEKVFKLWEGLGYYSRCKNLLATARHIANNLQGHFPDKYQDILQLKGVGPYTAAAIGSFAFNLPHAVVDGNVFRVLSRYFGITTPIDSTEGKKIFTQLAGELLHLPSPGLYNQALMDFGATVCKPQLPECSTCILNKQCKAFVNNAVSQYPVKEKSIVKKTRWLYYILAWHNNTVYVRKRTSKDIWQNLYEFMLIEQTEAADVMAILPDALVKQINNNHCQVLHISNLYKQVLTHQTIYGQFISLQCTKAPGITGYEKVTKAALQQLPFPKFISNYLKDNTVSLNLF
jgi:A/G-specific adenine glycosylase